MLALNLDQTRCIWHMNCISTSSTLSCQLECDTDGNPGTLTKWRSPSTLAIRANLSLAQI